MKKRIISALCAFLTVVGALLSTPMVKIFAAEHDGADDKYNKAIENGETQEDGRTYPHGSRVCPECGRYAPRDKRIPPEWRREHHPMPLPEKAEGEDAEIPEHPRCETKETAGKGNTAYSWYCMRNSTHTLPPIDRGMEFITDCNAVYGDTEAAKNGDKVIYLTFDAGYENGNVAKILDVLKKHNAKGAFFILENLIKREPDLVKRMSEEGHLVCNHTLSHPDMTKVDSIEKFAAQVEGLEKLADETLGIKVAKFYRPPEGRFSRRDLEYAKELGYKTVFWSFAYADWDNGKQPSLEYAEKKILDNVHPGEIMLLHPTSATNAAVLDSVLTKLESEGYRFGTLDTIV